MKFQRWSKVILWTSYNLFVFAVALWWFASAHAQDSGVHAPPTIGTYAYNSMVRPALGASYTDPIFGSSIRRLTNNDGASGADQNYAFHFVNADATQSFSYTGAAVLRIISTADGKVLYNSQPTGVAVSEVRWDMLDADKYYYFSGTDLVRRNVAAQTNTTMKTFPATLQYLGGSANYQTADGRYFVVGYSNTAHIWDSTSDIIFTNPISHFVSNGGWVGITPSGNHIVTAAGTTATPQTEHYAYTVDLVAKSIGVTPVQFWGLCGDHTSLISATNGKDYAVVFDCYNQQAVFRCDLDIDVAGQTPAQQEAAQFKLLQVTFADAGHFSAVSVGSLKNWVFFSNEATNDDDFNAAPSPWRAYKQEIIAIEVVSGAYRRLAHHRSRGLPSVYYKQPRVSTSPKGDVVLWASNFNVSSPADYEDLYMIANPLSTTYHPLKFVLLITTTTSTPISAGVPVPEYPTLSACDASGKAKVASLANPVAMRAGQRYAYQCLPVQGAANDQVYEEVA